jgi:drug/metabolite transporter (DMT)-like permease
MQPRTSLGLCGAICFSTKAIFVKLSYRHSEVEVITLLALRMLFSLPFFLASAWTYSRQANNIRFTPKQWLQVALVGCLGYYVSSFLDFAGLQFVSAGIERLILFVYPTFVLLLGVILFRKKVHTRQWWAVGITYLGLLVAFASEVSFNGGPAFYLGSALIFACAFTYALYIVGSGQLIPRVGAMKFNSYAMSFASVAVLLHFLATGASDALWHLPTEIYVYGLLMAIVSTVIPSYLVSASINRLGANNAAIVASVGPVSTILQAYYFLNESISGLQLLGTALILAGVLLVSWRGSVPKEVVL